MPWTPKTSRDMQRALHQGRPDFATTFPVDAIDAVVIHTAIAGNIAVRGDATDAVEVMGTGYRRNHHLLPGRIEIVDRTLHINGSSVLAYLVGFQRGKLELLVRVPEHVRVQIRMLAGVVLLHGGAGGSQSHSALAAWI